jgi:ergothioneine biosynthesis protein EgtB
MSNAAARLHAASPGGSLLVDFVRVRRATCRIAAPVAPEDCVAQSMPDASPVKWHLAHTSWFFEQFLLVPHLRGYGVFHPRYAYLFNSYYDSVGPRHARPDRGLLTRPRFEEVMQYRAHVDEHMARLLDPGIWCRELEPLLQLGINHEQQHQELMLTDLKHLLSRNPLEPAYRGDLPCDAGRFPSRLSTWMREEGGLGHVGVDSTAHFCFDNETPRHPTWLQPYRLASSLVTNAEYLEFVRAGGYGDPRHWLSDGWTAVQQGAWAHPLYWSDDLDTEFTLGGRRSLQPEAPVCHVSYYEADAFARWSGARLPSEQEWERVAARQPVAGNFVEADTLQPMPASADSTPAQFFGDTWEWTASAHAPYPGFRAVPGAVGEYNGKFMCNQMVLRGGSCVTPQGHVRPSYRNFFFPHSRWQFSGIRLAMDGSE